MSALGIRFVRARLRRALVFGFPGFALLLSACGDGILVPEARFGSVVVSLRTVGVSIDPNGYLVALAGQESRAVGVDGTITFTDVPEGSVALTLRDVAVTCDAEGGSSRRIDVQRFLTTTVEWSVVCTEKPIVFSSARGWPYQPQLHRMNLDGTGVRPLGSYRAMRPRWSPDGSRILFSDSNHLFVVSAEGLTPNRVAQGYGGSWSPDGQRIVFSRSWDDDWGTYFGELYTMSWSGGDERILTRDGLHHSPDWGPDGRIVFVEADQAGGAHAWLSVVDPAGGEPDRLYEGFELRDPVWSPDGSRIAFVGLVNGKRGIYSIAADGTDVRRRGPAQSSEAEPRWFGDGLSLLFTHYEQVEPWRSELRMGPHDAEPSIAVSHFPGGDLSGDVLRPR